MVKQLTGVYYLSPTEEDGCCCFKHGVMVNKGLLYGSSVTSICTVITAIKLSNYM